MLPVYFFPSSNFDHRFFSPVCSPSASLENTKLLPPFLRCHLCSAEVLRFVFFFERLVDSNSCSFVHFVPSEDLEAEPLERRNVAPAKDIRYRGA